MNISDFPAELLIAILIHTDALDVVRCRLVCSYFKGIIDSSSVLKYHIALYLASYVDGPVNNRLSTAERLRKLENHQASWRELRWQQKDSYTIQSRASTYELYGGVYAQGLTAQSGGNLHITRGMELIEFPSLLRNEDQARTWKIKDMGVDVKDFGMDPEKNLLVLMESPGRRSFADRNPPAKIHLRTMRTTEPIPHPLAKQPILSHRLQEYCPTHYFWVQIVGDRLAVLFLPMDQEHGAMAEMAIWDWQTGQLEGKLVFGSSVRVSSFSFISYDTFMVPTAIEGRPLGTIRLYRVTRSQDVVTPKLLAQYLLPEPSNRVLQSSLTCRADPAPWAPASRNPLYKPSPEEEEALLNDPRKPRPPPPFSPAPTSRIVVLSLHVLVFNRRAGQLRDYTIFMKSEMLLHEWEKHLPKISMELDEDGNPTTETVDVPWDSWGPENTRWTEEKTSEEWVCYVYGQRYCRVYRTESGDSGLQLMNFNEIPFKKEFPEMNDSRTEIAKPYVRHTQQFMIVADGDDDEWPGDDSDEWTDEDDDGDADETIPPEGELGIYVVTKPTTIKSVGFAQPVESRLPFQITRIEGPDVKELQRVLIDDERIIGVRRAQDTRRTLTLDVFTI
ncbi:hypothetical protein FRC03_004586 [Tulasnella sp. 419]|nr:hypothetical protein FRC03_004586 [Tulasnella sp. 419]